MDNEGDKTGQRFAAQLTAHRARVFAYVLTHVGANVTIAEDVTQDCFVRVFEARFQRPPPDGALYAYLRTTARNLLRDRFRRETRLRAADVETADTPDDRTPENQFVLRETAERLAAEVALMPPVLRETLRLRAVEGLDYPAIAVRMDCPVGTVRSRLHAARTRLRDGLAAAETVAPGVTATVRATEQHTTPRTGTTTTRYKEQKTMASTTEMAQIRAELQAMQARLTALETNKEESMGGTPDPWDAAIRHFGGDLVRERHEKGSGFALGLVHIVTQSAETGGGGNRAWNPHIW